MKKPIKYFNLIAIIFDLFFLIHFVVVLVLSLSLNLEPSVVRCITFPIFIWLAGDILFRFLNSKKIQTDKEYANRLDSKFYKKVVKIFIRAFIVLCGILLIPILPFYLLKLKRDLRKSFKRLIKKGYKYKRKKKITYLFKDNLVFKIEDNNFYVSRNYGESYFDIFETEILSDEEADILKEEIDLSVLQSSKDYEIKENERIADSWVLFDKILAKKQQI